MPLAHGAQQAPQLQMLEGASPRGGTSCLDDQKCAMTLGKSMVALLSTDREKAQIGRFRQSR